MYKHKFNNIKPNKTNFSNTIIQKSHTNVTVFSGSLHRSPSDRRRAVPNEDPLLLPRPDASHPAAARREELPHILPDARGTVPRRTGQTEPGGLQREEPQVPPGRRHEAGRGRGRR